MVTLFYFLFLLLSLTNGDMLLDIILSNVDLKSINSSTSKTSPPRRFPQIQNSQSVILSPSDTTWQGKAQKCGDSITDTCIFDVHSRNIARFARFDCNVARHCIVYCSEYQACNKVDIIAHFKKTSLSVICDHTKACYDMEIEVHAAHFVDVECSSTASCQEISVYSLSAQIQALRFDCTAPMSCKDSHMILGSTPIDRVHMRCLHPKESCASTHLYVNKPLTSAHSKKSSKPATLDLSCIAAKPDARGLVLEYQSCYDVKLVCNDRDQSMSRVVWDPREKEWEYFCENSDKCCPTIGQTVLNASVSDGNDGGGETAPSFPKNITKRGVSNTRPGHLFTHINIEQRVIPGSTKNEKSEPVAITVESIEIVAICMGISILFCCILMCGIYYAKKVEEFDFSDSDDVEEQKNLKI